MKNLQESSYETPQVEVLEVETEKGFATSPGLPGGNGEDGNWVN